MITTLVPEIWASAIWGLLGLICGYLLGRMGVQVAQDQQDSKQDDPKCRRPVIGNNVLGAFVVVLAIVTVVGLSISTSQTEAQVRCQTEFNSRFVDALQERLDAAARERQAQRELLTTVAKTREEGAKALKKYVQSLDEADVSREQNPYPIQAECDHAK